MCRAADPGQHGVHALGVHGGLDLSVDVVPQGHPEGRMTDCWRLPESAAG